METDDFGEYDLAPDAARRKDAGVGRAPEPAPATTTSPQVTLGYRARSEESAAELETIKNLYMPMWLLGGGVAIEVVAAFVRLRRLDLALQHVGLGMILSTVVMLAGMLLAARVRGIDLGNFWTAVFKLSAVSIAPWAVLTLFTPVLNVIPFGGLIGWVLGFAFYFALLGALFDLDQEDTWYCVCVIFLIRLGVYFLFLWAPWK
jgi:hypothetical protein